MDKAHPHRTELYASLCETAKLISCSLDGATERAILCANDGTILYMNPAAANFLCQTSSKHVMDVLVCDDWLTVKNCRVRHRGLTTRNDRNITVTKLDDVCPCCTRQYYTVYICSRHGKKTICCCSLDEDERECADVIMSCLLLWCKRYRHSKTVQLTINYFVVLPII